MRKLCRAFLLLLAGIPALAGAEEHWVGLDRQVRPQTCASSRQPDSVPVKAGLLADNTSGQLIERGGALVPGTAVSPSLGAKAREVAAGPTDTCRQDVTPQDGATISSSTSRLSRLAVLPRGMPLIAGRLSSGFGLRIHPLLAEVRMHSGVDIAAPPGSPIFATDSGRITSAGSRGGYGLAAEIEHANGLQTLYGHMSRLNVVAGQRVERGQIIGFVGSTGLSTGPHLHYEVRYRGQAVNPLFLGAPLAVAPKPLKSR